MKKSFLAILIVSVFLVSFPGVAYTLANDFSGSSINPVFWSIYQNINPVAVECTAFAKKLFGIENPRFSIMLEASKGGSIFWPCARLEAAS